MAYTNPLLFANNAGSSLAGPITNIATTLNVQSGGGALFPNPTGQQAFVITAIDAATGLLREIMLCVARSTDTLTVVRAQEGTTALSWLAGDLIQELWTAGQAASMVQTYQFTTPTNTYYVNGSTGNDSLYNGQASTVGINGAGPWATIQHAINVISTYIIPTGTVTVNIAAGTYAGNVMPSSLVQSWSFVGAGVASTTVLSNNSVVAPARGFVCTANTVSISNMTIQAYNAAINCQSGAQINITNCNLVLSVNTPTINCYSGQINLHGAINFLTNGVTNMSALGVDQGGFIQAGYIDNTLTPQTVTLGVGTSGTSSIAITIYAQAHSGGSMSFNSTYCTFTGSMGGQQYLCDTGGGIAAGGTTIPGTGSSGVVTSPGWYTA